MAGNRVILREYSEEDKVQVVDLLKRDHTEDYTIERWNWLHHNPLTLGSHIVVAESNGCTVGACGAIKKKFKYQGQTLIGVKDVDPVVDRRMRGKGVFQRMVLALNEMCNDVEFSYNFPNSASFPGFVKTGYRSIGPIKIAFCQLGFSGMNLKEKIRYFRTGARVRGKKHTDVQQGRFEDMKDLQPTALSDKFCLIKDYDYLTWRYAASPIKTYDVLLARRNGVILNACVVLVEDSGVSVMDCIEYEQEINLRDYLLAIKEIFGEVLVTMWDNSLSGIDRYFVGRSKHSFLVKDLKGDMPREFFDKKFWFVTIGEVASN